MSVDCFQNWLDALLADSRITDLCLNGPGSVFVDRGEGLCPLALPSQIQDAFYSCLRAWVLRQLESQGKAWDARHPFVDARIAPMHRLHAVFPPIGGHGIRATIRRLSWMDREHQARIANSFSRDPGLEVLLERSRNRKNMVLCGATGSGKTTLMNLLLARVDPGERIIALEDTPELAPAHPHFIPLESRAANPDGAGEVSLRDLLRQCLRMRPDRIVLGECRGAEVLDLLQALNTGHRGLLSTLHANSPREALFRIELLALLGAGSSMPLRLVRGLISSGLDTIVHLARENGARKIQSIHEIAGMEGDTILLRAVLEPPHARPNTTPASARIRNGL